MFGWGQQRGLLVANVRGKADRLCITFLLTQGGCCCCCRATQLVLSAQPHLCYPEKLQRFILKKKHMGGAIQVCLLVIGIIPIQAH